MSTKKTMLGLVSSIAEFSIEDNEADEDDIDDNFLQETSATIVNAFIDPPEGKLDIDIKVRAHWSIPIMRV